MSRAVRVLAPAKLTLSLRITGVRDDGYHLIDAEMVTLDLADELTIEPTAGDDVTITADGPYAEGMPLDGSNLVARAMRAAGRGGRVHVHKAVPHGGGLGGGSADAAAVLRWAGWSGTDPATLRRAARIGADVPFCLAGGRATVRGIGELLDPLPEHDPPLAVTLVIPPLSVSTPAAYRAWDELARTDPAAAHRAPNELSAAALVVEPELGTWRDRIAASSGVEPVLAGSGATWFVLGHHPRLAEALPGAVVVPTRTGSAPTTR